jgi:hypothetical protein
LSTRLQTGLQYRCLAFVPAALLFASSGATAADGAATVQGGAPVVPTDSLPGSPAPPGLGLSPEAPQIGPAPGATPSFGSPTGEKPSSSTFRIGGRFYGWEAVGIGEKPSNAPPGYSGTALHMPMLSTGKIPFWGGSGATLNFQYGSPFVTAYVSYYFRVNGPEIQGYTAPGQGPVFGTAYLMFTPKPINSLRLQIRVGAFTEVYAGPGQWGWGVFGPMLGLRGYGETTTGEMDLTRDVRLTFIHGVLINAGVPPDFVRGDYNSWLERGVSGWVHHAHVGLTVNNQWTFRLHYASDYATDERPFDPNAPDPNCAAGTMGCTPDPRNAPVNLPNLTFLRDRPGDGRMDVYIGEARWQGVPWGQIGVSGGLYNFNYAASVGDGVWWAVDFSQGGREMINKFLGPLSHGNGKVAVIGAEWNFSASSILWYPRTFTGQAPDLRVSIAGMLTRTLDTQDANYKNATGYYVGVETEYRMTSLFSLTLQTYGETRDSNLGLLPATYSVYSVNPGIAFHTDWLSTDRIQLIYGRRFYSLAADPNSAQPLDRNMIAIGGYITF